nr:hypothetical protein [Tanacetum cinerariifolium]
MSSITAQQAKLDHELVPNEKRLEIRKCNERLNPRMIQIEPTFQFVLDALAPSLCYSAFLITVDVPEVYMHQFWDSVHKHDTFYRFKIDKRKRFKLTLEIFRDIFKISPRVQGQDFKAFPTDEKVVSFLRELRHTREINSLNDVVVDHMHQSWRIFAALINKSLSGKITGIDKFRLYRAQILWIDNKAYKKQEKIYYPRFTKVIIHYFLTQEKTLSGRNKIGMHTSRDDYLINTLIVVSAKEETQIYGAILLECLTSTEMKETQAYQTYLVSTETPTTKSKRVKRPAKKSNETSARGVVIRETPDMPLTKKKEKVDVTHGKGIELLSQWVWYCYQNCSSVAKIKPSATSEETGVKPRVPDVAEEESSKSKAKSWGNDKEDRNNEQVLSDEDSDQEKESDDDKTQSDNENESDSKQKLMRVNRVQSLIIMKMKKMKTMKKQKFLIKLKKTEVPITNSSHSSDLVAKFLNFSDIPHTNAEIVSPLDLHVHHEVPSQQTPTLLTVRVSVIIDSSPIFSTIILQSLSSFTPSPKQSTSTPSPTTEATNPLSALPDFVSVFQFNNKVTTLKNKLLNSKRMILLKLK